MSPTIGGMIRIDLSSLHNAPNEDHLAGRAIQALANVPSGARIELVVAPKQIVPWSIAEVRCTPAGELVVVCSDPDTVFVWVTAIRTGDRLAAYDARLRRVA